MLRITELKLPLDHTDADLKTAIAAYLAISEDVIASFSVFKRSYDARKGMMNLAYIIDLDVGNLEKKLLAQFKADTHVMPTPDTRYHFVGQAPAQLSHRPVVVGFGPCGIFAALILAQMGFKPIVLERGKKVRERTKDTWDLWRKNTLHPES
ncbi:MAG: hypothetical protein ACRC01_12870, partial [Deefgea sp.]